jgi:hypothetical protein
MENFQCRPIEKTETIEGKQKSKLDDRKANCSVKIDISDKYKDVETLKDDYRKLRLPEQNL